MKDGGIYCCGRRQSAIQIVKEVAAGAMANIAVGNCACYGGLPAASPNPTGCVGNSGRNRWSGRQHCRMPDELRKLHSHGRAFLTFGALPELDGNGPSEICFRETYPQQL